MIAQPASEHPVAAQAAYWFNRQRSGDMSAEETRAFSEWRNADATHRAHYQRVERAWSVAGGMEDHPAMLELREAAERDKAGVRRLRAIGAAAAGIVVVAGAFAALSVGAKLGREPAREYRTDIGQRADIRLSDGSFVTLDTNTILRAQLSPWSRRITLERGQASFRVAKDHSRPFIVAAAGMSVRATGTAFDVRAETGRFEVTLIEGRVRVQPQGQDGDDAPMTNMRPGWRLAVGSDARWRMEPVDLVKETSWHNGTLTFNAEPLEKAAAEMNRYSRRQIVFRGPPPEKTIFGHFRAGDVEGFAEAAELNNVARVVSRTDERIELAAD